MEVWHSPSKRKTGLAQGSRIRINQVVEAWNPNVYLVNVLSGTFDSADLRHRFLRETDASPFITQNLAKSQGLDLSD